MNKLRIGIFGSGILNQDKTVSLARDLGKELGKKKVTIITGGCSGLPYQVAFEAHKFGSKIIGYSPVVNLAEQKDFTPTDDLSIYSKLIYIGKNFEYKSNRKISQKYRNVLSTAACDAGIIISGRWGTLNEFTNLMDMEKIIGVLTDTGGIADELPRLMTKIKKDKTGTVIFESSPKVLVKTVLNQLESLKK